MQKGTRQSQVLTSVIHAAQNTNAAFKAESASGARAKGRWEGEGWVIRPTLCHPRSVRQPAGSRIEEEGTTAVKQAGAPERVAVRSAK